MRRRKLSSESISAGRDGGRVEKRQMFPSGVFSREHVWMRSIIRSFLIC